MGTGNNTFGTYEPQEPSISLIPKILLTSCNKVENIYLNKPILLAFKVDGKKSIFDKKINVTLKPSDSSLQLFSTDSPSKTEFKVKKEWNFSVYLIGKKVISNARISIEVNDKYQYSIPVSVNEDKDIFFEEEIDRLLVDYDKSHVFNKSGAVIGNGYCILSADKGIGALLNDKTNFYSEPNLRSQGGNGIRLESLTKRISIIKELGYIHSSFTLKTNNYNTNLAPTNFEKSLKSIIESDIEKRLGYHVYYYSMHGEYHVMTLLIDNRNPCEVTYSILDQGYVDERNLDFNEIDDKFLYLANKFWSNRNQNAKIVHMYKIKRK